MTLKKKILLSIAMVLMLAIASFAIAISHDSPCPPSPTLAAAAARMHAIVRRCYGGPESLSYEEVDKPVPKDDQVLVKVRAASVNPADWHMMTGKPYVLRLSAGFFTPHDSRAGVDFAGTVEVVGKNVTRFKPGDEVFGGVRGAFAEYLVVSEQRSITHKPAALSFEEGAAIPIAGITALQALRDQGGLQAGQKVLINGASGGVGTYAVQIAKAFGAEVTGVSSTKNVELVRSLGADHVIDYTQEDVTKLTGRYHMIVDNVGNHSFSAWRQILEPQGIVVLVGGPKGPWIDPFIPIIKGKIVAPFVDERFVFFIAQLNVPDLDLLANLAQEGKLRSVVGSQYALSEAPAALELLGGRHARGKIVLRMN